MNNSETRYYTDLEIDLLIEDLTLAAKEAIDQAAGEAARAATLDMLDREAAALREAEKFKQEAETLRKNNLRNGFIIGGICFLGGFFIGGGIAFLVRSEK